MNLKKYNNEFKKLRIKYSKYIFDVKDFEIIKPIGEGGQGSVQIVFNRKTNQVYAVKTVHQGDKNFYKMANREIENMLRCHHPTIIKSYGISFQDFENQYSINIFMEYLSKGSMATYIKDQTFDNTHRQIILIGISRGLLYLHRNRIIHRDIKPLNILLDDNLYPKIIDFGYSKTAVTEKDLESSLTLGTIYYLAPEVFYDGICDEKSDVYSFAILMYEVLTGLDAYDREKNHNSFAFLNDVKEKNHRPKFDKSQRPIKESIKDLCKQCWSNDRSERPTFEEIFQKLAYNNDIQDSKDKYKYYLDDVDVDEVLKYASIIDVDCPEINLDTINNLTFYQINPLIKDNKQLKDEYKEINKIFSDFKDEVDLIKNENIEIKNTINSLQGSLSNSNNQITNIDQFQSIETKYEQKLQQMQDSFQKFIDPIINKNNSTQKELNDKIKSIERKYEKQLQQMQDSFQKIVDPIVNENKSLKQELNDKIQSIENKYEQKS